MALFKVIHNITTVMFGDEEANIAADASTSASSIAIENVIKKKTKAKNNTNNPLDAIIMNSDASHSGNNVKDAAKGTKRKKASEAQADSSVQSQKKPQKRKASAKEGHETTVSSSSTEPNAVVADVVDTANQVSTNVGTVKEKRSRKPKKSKVTTTTAASRVIQAISVNESSSDEESAVYAKENETGIQSKSKAKTSLSENVASEVITKNNGMQKIRYGRVRSNKWRNDPNFISTRFASAEEQSADASHQQVHLVATKRIRCMVCQKKTSTQCSNCDVGLCLMKRNHSKTCWERFHEDYDFKSS